MARRVGPSDPLTARAVLAARMRRLDRLEQEAVRREEADREREGAPLRLRDELESYLRPR